MAVINAAMAKRYWPNTDAVGKSFKFTGADAPITVIGVVADVRESLERDVGAQMYLPIGQETPQNAAVVQRSRRSFPARRAMRVDPAEVMRAE